MRFNFRGVGASAGSFDQGNGEQDDLRAVAAWVRAQRPDAALWLAGFSFGAFVSLRVAGELQPQVLVSIAPPVDRGWDFAGLQPPPQWLVIQGEADEIVDAPAVYRWLDSLEAPHELVRMPDTSHFFHRKLIDLRGALSMACAAGCPARQAEAGEDDMTEMTPSQRYAEGVARGDGTTTRPSTRRWLSWTASTRRCWTASRTAGSIVSPLSGRSPNRSAACTSGAA